MKIASVQMNSTSEKEVNVKKALAYIDQAAKESVDLISFPEYMNYLGGENHNKLKNSETINGPTTKALQEKAKEHNIHVHTGSILEEAEDGRAYNTSMIIDNKGDILSIYRKLHLFDIEIEGKVQSKESDTIKPGKEVVTADTKFGKMGLSICYDMRFPELYRLLALAGAKVIFVPAAFTLYTGIHHWETLLKARAIENECFVVASAQFGSHPPKNFTSFGSSMIIDPWGIVLARAPEREGFITADLDFNDIDRVRENVPVFKHRLPEIYGSSS